MILSKSDYMLFLRHPAWLWLKKFDKSKLPTIDDNLQALFDAGHEFEKYAERLFPDGIKLGFNNYQQYLSLPQRTKQALNENAPTIFQGRFEIDGITCIIDVLNKVEGNTFDLIEIKSSAKPKPEHFYDLAFQTIVLQKSGLNIRSLYVIHANSEYVRTGDIDPKKLTTKTNVTENAKTLINLTHKQIKKAHDILALKETPDISPRFANQLEIPKVSWVAEWIDIYRSLRPNLNDYSIYNLSYPSSTQIGLLEDKRIELIADVPEELALRDKQRAQIQTTRENQRIIDKDKIKEFLNTFEYPLYFFDYETFSSVIPAFDDCLPYKDYPFQYSLHILDAPGAKLRHREYLHQQNSNPMPKLIQQLKADIGLKGTILSWYMNYEKGCNTRMAKVYPEYKEFLASLNHRIKDLMIPFSQLWFVDKDFFGSASVKNIMPVLAPELSYKDLSVGDGLLARRTWTQTILEDKNPQNKPEIISDLSQYCTLDTFAMVRILEELRKLTSLTDLK